MKYNSKHYYEYFYYLLGFETPAISVGNTIMQEELSYFDDDDLTEEFETKLISDLDSEVEDIKYFNENEKVLTVHEFVSSFSREKVLSNLLD